MIDLRKKPTIEGDKIILRPFRPEDIEYMEECLRDPEVMKLTGSMDSDTFDRERIYNWYTTRNDQPDRLDFAIVDKATNEVVGETVINLYDEANHSMNFRILIGPRGRNRGLGSEATSRTVDYVFENTDLNQITLSVFAFNPRAKRVYEKVGFVLTSIDKDELEYEGTMIDSYNMVLTRENWLKTSKDKRG